MQPLEINQFFLGSNFQTFYKLQQVRGEGGGVGGRD